jgi:hypothetical protein
MIQDLEAQQRIQDARCKIRPPAHVSNTKTPRHQVFTKKTQRRKDAKGRTLSLKGGPAYWRQNDVPLARRFCLSSSLWDGRVTSSQLLNEEKRWRGLRSSRAQEAGPSDGHGASPCNEIQRELLCASAFLRVDGGICVICVICGQTGWVGGFVISLCLRVFVFATWVGGVADHKNRPIPIPLKRSSGSICVICGQLWSGNR